MGRDVMDTAMSLFTILFGVVILFDLASSKDIM